MEGWTMIVAGRSAPNRTGVAFGLAMACLLAGLLAFLLAEDVHRATTVALCGGITAAILCRVDRESWPILIGFALVGSFSGHLFSGLSGLAAFFHAGLGVLAGVSVANFLTSRFQRCDGPISLPMIAALFLAALTTSCVSALSLAFFHGAMAMPIPFPQVSQDFVSSLLTMLATMSTLLSFGAERAERKPTDTIETAAMIVAGTALSALIFWQTRQPALFTLAPIVVLAAVRVRLIDALTVVWAISLTAFAITFAGLGMIGGSGAGTMERLQILQLFVVIQTFMVLIIRAIIGERDRFGKAARESDQLFRRIAEASPVGFIHLDENGLPTFINRRWTEISGQTAQRAREGAWVDVVSARDRPAARSLWAQARASQTPVSAEFSYRRNDGDDGWLLLGIMPAIDDGKLLGFVLQISDVTARRAAERALYERERLYRLVTENSQDAILRVSLDGAILYASSALQRHFGIIPQQVEAIDIRALIDVEDRHVMDRLLAIGSDSLVDPLVQFRLRADPDAPAYWVEVSYRHLVDEQTGQPMELILSFRDIGQRRQLEEEQAVTTARLHESNRLLTMAEDLAKVGHWRFDLVRQTLECSDCALNIWGREPGARLDAHAALSNLDQENRRQLLKLAAKARASGLRHDSMIKVMAADGAIRHVRFGVQADLDVDGRVAGLFGVMRDKTEYVEANAALVEARDAAQAAARAKGQFLATMSHEIRTPMTGVLGMMDLLDGELSEEDRALYMATLKQSATLLMAVLDDILDFSRIESGALRLDRSDFNLEELVRSTVQLFANGASRKGVLLQFQAAVTGPPIVSADPVRLQQIVSNLIANAVKFTSDGHVTVHLREQPGSNGLSGWKISVADSGIGMTAEDLERLFQPFFQTDASRSGNFGGTGLGLAICRRIADAMGGQVSARSTHGKGSTFTLDLRLPPGQAQIAAPATETKPLPATGPSKSLRLLVADDNPVNQMLIAAILAKMGHQATVVENGRLAVEQAEAERFDAILMDMHMPEMDGLAATRAIRSGSGPCVTIPIVALTADASPERRRFYEGAGLTAFMAKPIDQRALANLLDSYGSGAASPATAKEGNRRSA